MLEARKANKVYTIEEKDIDSYMAQGYDIYDGVRLMKHAANKTVPIDVYEAAVAEIEELQKEVASLKKASKKTVKKAKEEE